MLDIYLVAIVEHFKGACLHHGTVESVAQEPNTHEQGDLFLLRLSKPLWNRLSHGSKGPLPHQDQAHYAKLSAKDQLC